MMKAVFWGLMLATALAAGFQGMAAGPAGTADDLAALVKGNNAFAFDLYKALAGDEGNLFVSPYSISSALTMTYAGARNETARQMERALHYTLPADRLHPTNDTLNQRLNAKGKSYQLAVANALWAQQGLIFNPEFLRVTRDYYKAGLKEVDYANQTEQARQTINRWVEEKTNHKIVDLIKPKILTSLTRLVLTNAIYFKGQWDEEFKRELTKPAPFAVSEREKPEVPLMYRMGTVKYAETDQTQLAELVYKGGEVAMDVLLPKAGTDLAKLEKELGVEGFQTMLAKLKPVKVDLFLPRFKLEKEYLLNESLKGLGMKDAFDDQRADFSGIGKIFLYIQKVVHKSFVEVNEEGTEAAAATGVVMGTKSAPIDDKPKVFRADHPFLFIIRELRTGSILFMGRMSDPRK